MHTLFALAAVAALQPHTPLPSDLEAAAKYQLYAAYGAYCPESQLSRWSCKWCKQIPIEKVYGVYSDQKHDGQVYAVRTKSSEIIVSFRGSHNIKNWISDFTFDKIKLDWEGVPSGIEVHQGFLRGYEALRPNVTSWVAQARRDCPTCTVHVTGHSMGAAQAVLCVADLRLQGLKPEMWNFGLPRVGGKPFADWFNKGSQASGQTMYHMVNKRDIVPHLPPADIFFHHISLEVWRAPNNTYVVCDGTGEDKECSRSIPAYARSVEDHLQYMGVSESCY